MHDGTFQKIDENDERTIGPKGVLVSGYDTNIEPKLGAYLNDLGLADHRVVFCTKEMVRLPLGEALAGEHSGEIAAPDALPRVMILSGMTGGQLQAFVSGYRNSGIPRPIFASATPANLEFPIRQLIMELLREQRAMAARR